MEDRVTIPDLHVVPREIQLPHLPEWGHRFAFRISVVSIVAGFAGACWEGKQAAMAVTLALSCAVVTCATWYALQWVVRRRARLDRAVVEHLAARPMFIADLATSLRRSGDLGLDASGRLRESVDGLVASGWARSVNGRYVLPPWVLGEVER